FYRHFWPVIEKDVFEAVDYFFMYGEIPNGCNSNFIALIPKILDANMVKDFRPISLIGSLYKIIAKILANRLVGVLGDLVNEVQSAFVADRQILDGPFILDEVLQWCRRKKKHALIFKVDFEKAFDLVRWDFVDDVLNKFGMEDLDSKFRFFNGQDSKINKASWVKWNKVLTPKDKGGLGVSSLFALNRGLMLKWVWRFYSQKCSLWTKVIKAIYGEDVNLNKDVSGGVRTCWRLIVHEVRVLQGRGINVADYIRLKMGNGENTRF
ncbi:RNA-directed DNA polymerase, eukaryota, reverse transcriptase zinc-binding domain protein, partial [Tanacetum coccineum]